MAWDVMRVVREWNGNGEHECRHKEDSYVLLPPVAISHHVHDSRSRYGEIRWFKGGFISNTRR